MKYTKIKFFSLLSAFILVVLMLIVGVYASGHTINIKGNIRFEISDSSLFVKDIRISQGVTGFETIKDFIPGFVNEEFDLDLGQINSATGVVVIELEMINTTTTIYEASTSSTVPNANISVSGTIKGEQVPIEEVLDYTGNSGIITLTITPQSSTAVDINLDGLVITMSESQNVEVTLKGDYLDAYVIGEGSTEIIYKEADQEVIYVPVGTKICVACIGTSANLEIWEIDWGTLNQFPMQSGGLEPDPDQLELWLNGEIIDVYYLTWSLSGAYALVDAVIEVTESCAIEIHLTRM